MNRFYRNTTRKRGSTCSLHLESDFEFRSEISKLFQRWSGHQPFRVSLELLSPFAQADSMSASLLIKTNMGDQKFASDSEDCMLILPGSDFADQLWEFEAWSDPPEHAWQPETTLATVVFGNNDVVSLLRNLHHPPPPPPTPFSPGPPTQPPRVIPPNSFPDNRTVVNEDESSFEMLMAVASPTIARYGCE